jgi:hypothetical protein
MKKAGREKQALEGWFKPWRMYLKMLRRKFCAVVDGFHSVRCGVRPD